MIFALIRDNDRNPFRQNSYITYLKSIMIYLAQMQKIKLIKNNKLTSNKTKIHVFDILIISFVLKLFNVKLCYILVSKLCYILVSNF